VTEARRTHPVPEIVIADFVAGAREARGLVVVIDVFRAFSVACYAHAQGAARPATRRPNSNDWICTGAPSSIRLMQALRA
jgi:hypothetical protein